MPVTSLFWCHANPNSFTCSACDNGLRKESRHVKYHASLSNGADTQRDVFFVPCSLEIFEVMPSLHLKFVRKRTQKKTERFFSTLRPFKIMKGLKFERLQCAEKSL